MIQISYDGPHLPITTSSGELFPGTFIGWTKDQLRPPDFESLAPSEQWEIDKKLGILDWDGKKPWPL